MTSLNSGSLISGYAASFVSQRGNNKESTDARNLIVAKTPQLLLLFFVMRRDSITSMNTQTAKQFTAAEIAVVGRGDWRDCEFVDFVGLEKKFGIRRSTAYNLLKDGVIRGVSLRRRGRTRGKRLFDVQSVREYLKACADA